MICATDAAGAEWSGIYTGVEAGGGETSTDIAPSRLISLDTSYNVDTPILSAFAGYNWQSGPWVLGTEARLSSVDIRYGDVTSYASGGSVIGGVGGVISGGEFVRSSTTFGVLGFALQSRFDAAFTASAGYDFGRVMPYVRGGIAIRHARAEFLDAKRSETVYNTGRVVITDSGGLAVREGWDIGYTVGAGAAIALDDKLFLRGEYAFTQFADETIVNESARSAQSFDQRRNDVRFGLGYRF